MALQACSIIPSSVQQAPRETGVLHQVVVKSQILAGGRGLGTFKGGLKGGVHIVEASKALDLAKRMLGDTLVTKQTGPAGKPVGTLFIASKLQLTREMYFAILLDRKTAGDPLLKRLSNDPYICNLGC